MTRILKIYDHTNSAVPADFLVDLCPSLDARAIKVAGLEEIGESDGHALVHVPNSQEWELLVGRSGRDTVRVRVSTEGLPAQFRRTSSGSYAMQLREPVGNLGAGEWRELVTFILNVESLASLARCPDGRGTARFFIDTPRAFLGAISILCQGFLVVHADREGNPVICDDDQQAEEMCRRALTLMGWTKLCHDRSELLTEVPETLEAERPNVKKRDWWRDGLGTTRPSSAEIEAEAQGRPLPAVTRLLDHIYGGGTNEASVTHSMAAEAYIEICGVFSEAGR